MTTKRKTQSQSLPRGRHGLPRELVVENQRARLLSGMIETSVGDEIAERHHVAIRELVEELLAKMPPALRREPATEIRTEAFAGGLSRLAAMKVRSGEAEDLPALLPNLVELFLRSYPDG